MFLALVFQWFNFQIASEFVGEHIEHQKRIAVFIFHLFGGFAINGCDEKGLVEKGVAFLLLFIMYLFIILTTNFVKGLL